ncbi:DUF2079 domain-containing protein [Sanguibacter sp. Leaf3]|uniref:DUF2079 domain-containing protein n=1 Tax=Sanguibacter sp. Leaf3 TaxID=1736209 RepID=UPI0009E93C22|nr:DUF2079 domain-containing protein [Sanguibacter sp. Leaf3]
MDSIVVLVVVRQTVPVDHGYDEREQTAEPRTEPAAVPPKAPAAGGGDGTFDGRVVDPGAQPESRVPRALRSAVRGPLVHWPVTLLTFVAFAAYLTLSLARWYRWENPSWDNAIFEQAVAGYARLGAPIVPIKGPDFNQLGDHFSPLLVVLAPFYRLFPSPVTLLVAQCVLVAVSIVPITLVARRLLGAWPGLAVGFAYAFAWGIQSAVDVQFHEYSLAVPILAFGMAAFLTERWRASAIWVVLLLGVKEDLGLTVAAFGVVLWLRGQRRLGAVVAATGAVGFVLVLTVIIPFFNPQGRYDYWGKLSEDGSAASSGSTVSGLLDTFAGLLTPAVKIETLVMLVVITALVALRSPLALVAVPTLVWRFAGSTVFYWGTTWHYSVILMPILFAAAIDGIVRLRASRFELLRTYARLAPAAMAVVAAVLVTQFPLRDLWSPATYERSDRIAAAERAVAAVPAGASVASDRGLIVQLATDREVYWISTDPSVRPDYVVVDRLSWGGNAPVDVEQYAERAYPGTTYSVVFDEDGYVIVERTAG